MPKVSVIVPIYKVEKYLDACVESILAQTFADFELILVDDGSPDACPAMCDAWAQKDSRIKVIHKENGGLVSARIAGAAEANGRYIQYVDGDDAILPEMLSVLCLNAEETGADIVQCGATIVYEDEGRIGADLPVIIKERRRFFSSAEIKNEWMLPFVRDGIYPEGIDCYVWNKLYKAEIVKKVVSNLNCRISMREDVLFNLWAYSFAASKLELQACPLYLYTQRKDSISHEFNFAIIDQVNLFASVVKDICGILGYPTDGLKAIRNHVFVGHMVQCVVGRYPIKQKAMAFRVMHREMSGSGELFFEAKRCGGTLGLLLILLAVGLHWPVAAISEAALAFRRK